MDVTLYFEISPGVNKTDENCKERSVGWTAKFSTSRRVVTPTGSKTHCTGRWSSSQGDQAN